MSHQRLARIFLKSQYAARWWHTIEIPALRKLRQHDWEFKACLGYIVKPCLKNQKSVRQ
jgi:hypothetical protein